MGDFDQFKDQANEYADKAKQQLGNKRGKSAKSRDPREQERGMREEGQERASGTEQDARRMGRESEGGEDDWADA
jgi:hypothetical protein